MKKYITIPTSYLGDPKKQYAILERGKAEILAYAASLPEALEIFRILEVMDEEEERKK